MICITSLRWLKTGEFGLGESLFTLIGAALIGFIVWGKIHFKIGSVEINLEQNKKAVERILLILVGIVGGFSLFMPNYMTREVAETDDVDDVATAATEQEVAGIDQPNDLNPVEAQIFVDDVTIGKNVVDGMIPSEAQGDDFAPGETVTLAMKVADAPAGSRVKIVWFGPGETRVGEQEKTVNQGDQYLTFQAANTSSWQKGDYRAEVWVGDEKVNQQQFQIVDASEAGK